MVYEIVEMNIVLLIQTFLDSCASVSIGYLRYEISRLLCASSPTYASFCAISAISLNVLVFQQYLEIQHVEHHHLQILLLPYHFQNQLTQPCRHTMSQDGMSWDDDGGCKGMSGDALQH